MRRGLNFSEDESAAPATVSRYRVLWRRVAHPTRFERVASTFGEHESHQGVLPEKLMTAIHFVFEDGPKLPHNAFDDLGDVRVVGEVIRKFEFLFAPKKKS